MGRNQTPLARLCLLLKHLCSTALTLGGLGFICFGIAIGKSSLTSNPVLPFVVLVLLLCLMGYLEGIQLSLLALHDATIEDYRLSHPGAYKLLALARRPLNFQRFLIGRQFTVLFVVMLLSAASSFPTLQKPGSVPGFLWSFYVSTALYQSLVVMAFGSLMPQLIAQRHAVFFCNLPGAIWVLRMTLLFEALGVGHFSWLLSAGVWRLCRCFGAVLRSEDEKDKRESSSSTMDSSAEEVAGRCDRCVRALRCALDGLRYLGSTALTLAGLAFICYGIATGKADMTANPVVPFVIFPLAIMLNGYCEGLQLSILKLPEDAESFRSSHSRAYRMRQLMGDDTRVQKFLVGRQFTVIFIFMLISQVSTFTELKLQWVPALVWVVFVKLTIYQALVVVSFGSLMPQLIATNDPLFFCNLPGALTVLRLLMLLEATGIPSFAWILAAFVQRLCGFRSLKDTAEAPASKLDISDKQQCLVEP